MQCPQKALSGDCISFFTFESFSLLMIYFSRSHNNSIQSIVQNWGRENIPIERPTFNYAIGAVKSTRAGGLGAEYEWGCEGLRLREMQRYREENKIDR